MPGCLKKPRNRTGSKRGCSRAQFLDLPAFFLRASLHGSWGTSPRQGRGRRWVLRRRDLGLAWLLNSPCQLPCATAETGE